MWDCCSDNSGTGSRLRAALGKFATAPLGKFGRTAERRPAARRPSSSRRPAQYLSQLCTGMCPTSHPLSGSTTHPGNSARRSSAGHAEAPARSREALPVSAPTWRCLYSRAFGNKHEVPLIHVRIGGVRTASPQRAPTTAQRRAATQLGELHFEAGRRCQARLLITSGGPAPAPPPIPGRYPASIHRREVATQ